MDYKISASILNADFSDLKSDISEIIDAVDEIHCDVMDGSFVDNISFGAPVIKALKKTFPHACYDTHLMISDPGKYYGSYIDAGSDILVFHYEATPHSHILLSKIRESGIKGGLSLTPATPVQSVEPVKELLDRLLIMTVEPGFGGQKYIDAMNRKIEAARKMLGDGVDIQVDGGINDLTLPGARDAGANVFVVGSFIFRAEDKLERVRSLRSLLK